MDENVSRPIIALQIVLKLKTRLRSPIFNESPHVSDRGNRHHLGNLTGERYLKTVTTTSNFTPNSDVSVTWSFGVV